MINIKDAVYGLRNLTVGDDEETRIEDILDQIEPWSFQEEIRAIVEVRDYERAYERVIWSVLKSVPLEKVEEEIFEFVMEFTKDDDDEDLDDIRISLRVDMLNLFLAIQAKNS